MGRLNQRIFTLAMAGMGLMSSPLMAQEKGTKFSGGLDVNYAYNFNKPSPAGRVTNNPGATFANYNNNFTLNNAEFGVVHSADPITLTLNFGFGEQSALFAGDSAGGGEHVHQAFMTYKCPDTGIIVDIGKFGTHLGYEGNRSADNWNYTRSFAYQYMAPVWHHGIKATYPHEKFSVGLSFTNGTDDAYDNNKTKDLGLQVTVKPMDKFDVSLNYLKSVDHTVTPANDELYWDLIAHFNLNDDLGFGAHYATREQEPRPSGTGKELNSIALYGNWKFHEKWSLAPRFEMFDDKDGVANVGAAVGKNDITSITLTVENRVTANMKWRVELRNDKSDKKVYTSDNGTVQGEDTQNLLVFGFMAGF